MWCSQQVLDCCVKLNETTTTKKKEKKEKEKLLYSYRETGIFHCIICLREAMEVNQ